MLLLMFLFCVFLGTLKSGNKTQMKGEKEESQTQSHLKFATVAFPQQFSHPEDVPWCAHSIAREWDGDTAGAQQMNMTMTKVGLSSQSAQSTC